MPKGIPTNGNRKYTKANPSWFKKGIVHTSNWAKGRFGEKSPVWKGDEVCYRGLHLWVKSRLGAAIKCENCGKMKTTPKSIHWANKSHLYKRELNDWLQLCAKCHKRYDKKIKKHESQKNIR